MFIDIHHHLVYGIDDGAKDFGGTKRLIQDAAANQVSVIVTTPHMTPGIEPFPEADYRMRLEEARGWIRDQGLDLILYSGAEVLYTQNTPPMLADGRVPTLADSSLVLLEFLPDCAFRELEAAGNSVAQAGYAPVYAHAERYICLKKPDQVKRLRQECGALIQVNANTVLKPHGFFRRHYLNALFENGLVDFVASDSHDLPGRENHLSAAFQRLSEQYGEEMAKALTFKNAEKLILDRE